MTIFMETTKISAERTVGQIQSILAKYGATHVLTEYSGGQVEALSFRLEIDKNFVPFRLPCRFRSIGSKLKRGRNEDNEDWDARQRRIAWRQILRWVEAQCALVETSMVKM